MYILSLSSDDNNDQDKYDVSPYAMFSKCIGFGYHFVMIKTKTKSFKHQMWGLKDIRYRFPVDVGAKKFPVRFCLF